MNIGRGIRYFYNKNFKNTKASEENALFFSLALYLALD